ncbi:MAG: hypothetical protein ACRDWV_09540, partial [Acidimicrobiales bacterium]
VGPVGVGPVGVGPVGVGPVGVGPVGVGPVGVGPVGVRTAGVRAAEGWAAARDGLMLRIAAQAASATADAANIGCRAFEKVQLTGASSKGP